MRKKKLGSLIIPLVLSLSMFPKPTDAYTDYSVYRVETGEFLGENNVAAAVQRLKKDTGWWASYVSTRKNIPYYQVYSGGFYGEKNVKETLNKFQASTGLTGKIKPLGGEEPYYQIVSGAYYGKDHTEKVLQSFKNETGYTGTIEPTGALVYKQKIFSGAYFGEDNVKNVIQQFKAQTGISVSYQETGPYKEATKVISGGFNGEDQVKTILQNFVAATGLKAEYEPIGYTQNYIIQTGGFYGEETVKAIVYQIKEELGITAVYQPTKTANIYTINFNPLSGSALNKVTNYLDSKNWWYSKIATGNKIPTTFRIVSEPTFDIQKVNQALNFYKANNWWATTSPSGVKVAQYFNILTESLSDPATIQKGLNFFKNKNLWVTTQQSNEKDYVYFNIISEPILGKDNVKRATDFFQRNKWWHTERQTNKKGYTIFQIETEPLLGEDKKNAVLNFFKQNNWWAASRLTGKTDSYYKIITGGFQGYDNAVAQAKMVTDKYGWWTTVVKIENGPKVKTTDYNLTLNEMANLQMGLSTPPQTDKYRNEPAYVHSAYIDPVNKVITGNGVNVRKGPGTNYDIVAKLNKGFKGFSIVNQNGEWTQISLTWKNASYDDVLYYLNPNNFSSSSKEYYQFLKLSQPAETNINEINEKILNQNTGILMGKAAAFVQAAKLYGINELYLIAHALHETGNGKSALAQGVMYNGKKVYNMYGYNAFDGCAVECGAKKAYEEGWFTPEAAIIGGAKLIGQGYIYNDTFQQDTLYKMRWNPVIPYHQYATDVGWAAKQVTNLYNYYKMLDKYTLYFDIPVYK
jgi:mannosyl-glycoprotein endo-beta-N-acetylglucosaminidase